jgi:hypothetical protein
MFVIEGTQRSETLWPSKSEFVAVGKGHALLFFELKASIQR